MGIQNSPSFEWATRHVSYEPDFIYFDDEQDDEETKMSETSLGARLIISELLSASEGNLTKLHALLAVFSGMTLREAGKTIGKSHEFVRLCVESIKEKHPELHGVLTDNRYKVDALIPKHTKKWTILNLDSNRTEFCDSLLKWCEEKNIQYHLIRQRVEAQDGIYSDQDGNNYKISRNY